MAKTSLAALEEVLRARKLDCTLTSTRPLADGSPDLRIPTGIPALDDALRGGLPRGQLSEVAGAPSSGRTALVVQMIAETTRRGELAVLVDTFDRLDVASLAAGGVDLDRFLWIRGHATGSVELGARNLGSSEFSSAFRAPRSELSEFRAPRSELADRLVARALKALNLVLQAGGFGFVAIDLADVPLAVLNRIPYTTWPRLQRTLEGRDTACVLVSPRPLARSAGGITLSLAGGSHWMGDSRQSCRLAGLDVTVRLMSPRRHMEGDVRVRCAVRD